MRVALVSDWFLPRLGGIELQLRDLALQLRARGHEVEIITPFPGPDVVEGIPVHRLGTPRLPGAGVVFTSGAFQRLRELLETGRYDVAHVHFGIIAPAAYGGAALAHALGIPAVATFHSVLTHFDVPLWLVASVMAAREWRVRWTAVSSVVARSIRPLVGDAPVDLLPNGIDTRWWAPPGALTGSPTPADAALTGSPAPADAALTAADIRPSAADAALTPRPPGEVRAVSVMRLHRRKRPLALVNAVAEAVRALPPTTRLKVEILGDGPEEGRLRRRIRALGLEDTVTLSGWMPREAVRDALHRADLFVLPSRLEAFGIAALEARAAGLPVIAMREAGVRDFLEPGRDALLVKSDRELAAAIATLAGDREQLAAMREVTRTPPAGFDWAGIVEAHERLYRSGGLAV